MKQFLIPTLCLILTLLSPGFAQEEAAAAEAEAPSAPTIVVLVPEKIGDDANLGGSSNESLLVQAEIEKRLVRKGLELQDIGGLDPRVDTQGGGGLLSWQTMTVKDGALTIARKVGADYLVYGQATAVKAGQGSAYGVTAVRAQADIVVRLVRVSDGKVLEIFDGSALEGDQAFGIAAKRALKVAAKPVAKSVADAAEVTLN